MEPQESSFAPDDRNLSEELQAAMQRTHAALQRMWDREKQEEESVYEITIPAQELSIIGKERSELVLKTLRDVRISGTYRVTRK